MIKNLLDGGITIHYNFFTKEKFNSIKSDLDSLKWDKVHQPAGSSYGNRMQAFPCYENQYDKEIPYEHILVSQRPIYHRQRRRNGPPGLSVVL